MNDVHHVVADGPARTASLAEALVAAQEAAQAVGKRSINEYHRYKYASSEDVIAEARAALSAAGLSVRCASSLVRPDPAGMGVPTLVCMFVVTHLSGDCREAVYETPVILEKGRPWDKAVGAARTYSLSYYLRDLLLLPRVEQNEVDERDDRQHEGKGAAPTRDLTEPLIASLEARAKKATDREALGKIFQEGTEAKFPKDIHERLVAACRNRWNEIKDGSPS